MAKSLIIVESPAKAKTIDIADGGVGEAVDTDDENVLEGGGEEERRHTPTIVHYRERRANSRSQ